MAMAERNCLGELIRPLSLVELLLDGLPELEIVTVPQNEDSLRGLPKLFHGPVQRMLPGIGVQSLEELGSRGYFKPDGRDKAKHLVPLTLYATLLSFD